MHVHLLSAMLRRVAIFLCDVLLNYYYSFCFFGVAVGTCHFLTNKSLRVAPKDLKKSKIVHLQRIDGDIRSTGDLSLIYGEVCQLTLSNPW